MRAFKHKNRHRRLSEGDTELGLDCTITRRDFLNSTALGIGAALLGQPAPAHARSSAPSSTPMNAEAFDGYGGTGDYARSNGNTWNVVQAAHAMRDGRYAEAVDVTDTGEVYDVVVVGGGFAGLGAAHRTMQLSGGRKTCLVLDNHPMFGGEAKRNEFLVDGVRLLAPQGSNEFVLPGTGQPVAEEVWRDLGLPREFAYSELSAAGKALETSRSNYIFHLWADTFESHGFFIFDEKRWVTNPWGRDLSGMPWSPFLKAEMLRWRRDPGRYDHGHDGTGLERWLDSMSYEQYLTRIMRLPREVARYADPVLAAAGGLGSDATSACMAWGFGMPGFQGVQPHHAADNGYALGALNSRVHRFPGGNEAILRAFVKRLIPDAIPGSDFGEMHNSAVKQAALDRAGGKTRIRLPATATAVKHEGSPDSARHVAVTYLKDGRLYKLRARGVVMACGSWTAKHVVHDLPREHRDAMDCFYRSPMLVINVALTNWRPLYRLGYTAASWRDGRLGFSFNLSPPMQVGGYRPAFDPDQPAVLTCYVPFIRVGMPVARQGAAGRAELLSTTYREYERIVRAQLIEMLSGQGFDVRRDIAGIILNRWGHAYVNPYPGFYFGRDGKPAPSDVVRSPFGRIAFGHSELRGHQNWNGAVEEGRRAAEQIDHG